MMDLSDWNSRTQLIAGQKGVERLASSRILIVGVGGVGGYAAEMLARAGAGHLTLLDADTVSVSNLNRQLIALIPDIGKEKTSLFAERFREINPSCEVEARCEFLIPEGVGALLDEGYDYVVDAIDTVAPKVALLAECLRRKQKVISSMGAGGRVDPTKVGYFDLWETREDGLARAVRQRLKREGLRRPLCVVASTEAPRRSSLVILDEINKRSSFGTLPTIPSLFGIFLAARIINEIVF